MKRLLFTVLMCGAALWSVAQADNVLPREDQKPVASVDNEIYSVVSQDPQYPGGQEAMAKFLSDNLVYPAEARDKGITGRVVVTFVVEKDGNVSNVKVLRDIGGGCGAEAVRVVKKMPRWKPGKANGKAVRTQFTLPLNFSL